MAKEDPLRIISVEKRQPHLKHSSSRLNLPKNRVEEARQAFELKWKQNPDQFNPTVNAIERERIERTWNLMEPFTKPGLKATDLGCGWGVLSEKMAEAGFLVDAVDIASTALDRLRAHAHEHIRLLCDAAPSTGLLDDTYDLVLCTDLIAEIQPQDHRLLVSELYRLTQPEGHVICSTPLDIRSDGAIERFASLIESELEPESWVVSHHAYYLKLRRLLSAPGRYAQAMTDTDFYKKQSHKAGTMGKGWLWLNSTRLLGSIWKAVSWLLRPLIDWYDQSRTLLLKLESLCRFLSPDDGISHVIILAKLKPFKPTQDVDVQAMSRPVQRLRQRVWE